MPSVQVAGVSNRIPSAAAHTMSPASKIMENGRAKRNKTPAVAKLRTKKSTA
jgi:hypothetical protein